MNNKYNAGDVVEMNNTWNNRYGIILNIDHINKQFQPVYRIIIQGLANPSWVNHKAIVRKVE